MPPHTSELSPSQITYGQIDDLLRGGDLESARAIAAGAGNPAQSFFRTMAAHYSPQIAGSIDALMEDRRFDEASVILELWRPYFSPEAQAHYPRELEANIRLLKGDILGALRGRRVDQAIALLSSNEKSVGAQYCEVARDEILPAFLEKYWSAGSVTITRPELTPADRELAAMWGEHSSYDRMRNLSARTAEKVALQFLDERFPSAYADISIHQLEAKSNLWRQGDIAGPAGLIDVKNSRRGSKYADSYSEHCVPRFKTSRGKDVEIMGILSPYSGTDDIVVLGFTSSARIEQLTASFQSGLFQFEFNQFYPPWLFEFPAAFSSDRKKASPVIGRLLKPPFTQSVAAESSDAVRRFKEIEAKVEITLPVMFMGLLESKLRFGTEGLDSLERLLSTQELRPLVHIPDPVKCIPTLLTILRALEPSLLRKFKSFRLSSKQILRGKPPDGPWQTIFTYCGGRRADNAACGAFPLTAGTNELCHVCLKLICHRCNFCQMNCSELQKRGYSHSRREHELIPIDEDPAVNEEPTSLPEWDLSVERTD
jgi:hypothetical protein